jgi:hypothetical protein
MDVQTIMPAPPARLDARRGANNPAKRANQKGSLPSELVATTDAKPTMMLKHNRANPTEKKPINQAKIAFGP